jgi:hypothetical protein
MILSAYLTFYLNQTQRFHIDSTPGVSSIRPFSVRRDLLAETSAWCFPVSIQLRTNSTVQDVILYIPHFSEALLRNIPYRYVFLEKRSAGMKLRNKIKFRQIPAHFEHWLVPQTACVHVALPDKLHQFKL